MRDQFYMVLSSNNSTHVFPENTAAHFTNQLPQNICLHGEWCVALCEIQIPHTFQHISFNSDDGMVSMKTIKPRTNELRNNIEEEEEYTVCYISPGIYEDMESLLQEINSLFNIKNHLQFKIQRGGFIEIERTCASECDEYFHSLVLSPKLLKILGIDENNLQQIRGKVIGEKHAALINALPPIIRVYSEICEPYITGDVHTPLLRIVPLNLHEYKYSGIEIKNYNTPMYIPLLSTSFQSITIDIKGQDDEPLAFDYGTLTVTLHFKRTA